MEDIIFVSSSSCPLSQISWLWYFVSVLVVFGIGTIWYGLLFSKAWLKAVDYTCACGADMANGETCTCESRSVFPMIMQLIATALIGLMYFILTPLSIWLSVIVLIAASAWMKAGLKFKIAEWKRFMILASIEVGYFFIASLVFILFALF